MKALAFGFTLLAALSALAQTGLAQTKLTVEQALELSQKTGRPILAVAGQDT